MFTSLSLTLSGGKRCVVSFIDHIFFLPRMGISAGMDESAMIRTMYLVSALSFVID